MFHEHTFPYSSPSYPSLTFSPTPVPFIDPINPGSPPTAQQSLISPPTSFSHPSPFSLIPPPIAAPIRHSSKTSHPPAHLSYYIYFSSPQLFISELHLHEPQYYQQVASHPTWQESMLKEFQALDTNHTWDIVPLFPTRSLSL